MPQRANATMAAAPPVAPPAAAGGPPRLKCGYLLKQSSGKWKRRRWNQRWVVLHYDTGVLTYFRHASQPEAVPLRQDAHGSMQLKGAPGVSLVIQGGGLSHGVPAPFCFTVSDATKRLQLRLCADTNQDFKEWTSAIASVMSPPEQHSSGDAADMPSGNDTVASVAAGTRSLEEPFVATPLSPTVYSASSSSSPSSASSSPRPDRKLRAKGSGSRHVKGVLRRPSSLRVDVNNNAVAAANLANMEVRSWTRYGTVALIMANPIVVIVRFGSLEVVYACILLLNVAFVWLLWFRETDKDGVLPLPPTLLRASSAFASPSNANQTGLQSQSELPKTALLRRTSSIPPITGKINGIRARAGASVAMCTPEVAVPNHWSQVCATRFNVRQGPNYRKNKRKAASTEALLNLVAIDVFRSDGKIDNVGSIVDLSSLKPADSPLDLFIVNFQVPSYQPPNPLWGEKVVDGVGINCVTYLAIPPAIREQLNSSQPASQAVRLLKRFLQDDPGVRDRFKAIGVVVNPKEQDQLGRTERHLLETYNGQPILTRPQHRFYQGDRYFEIDVDAHTFNYVARKGLVSVSDHICKMIVDFGLVLEGQDDDELPEQILGCVRLCKIDVMQAPHVG